MKLVVLGAPGAGKGTQAHFVSEHYDIPHISTGDLLRDHMKRGTEIGKQITNLMEQGMLVPDEVVIKILKERIVDADCKNGFLLDGFPRTRAQAEITESITGALNKVVSVHVDDAVIIERMSGRRICSSCGATYHMVYKPPKKEHICDQCGGTLIQRNDDKAKTVRNRLDIYHGEAEPIKEFFKKENKLAIVDGVGEISDITKEIIKAIDADQK